VFTIDLLKGQGIPIKTMPGGMILTTGAFFVPALFAVVIFGNYLHSSIIISTQKKQLNDYDAKIAQLSASLEAKRSLEQEVDGVILFMHETADCIDHQMRWSPVLEFLARNIPESLVLEQLKVITGKTTKTVSIRGEPERKTNIFIPTRTLSITLFGVEQAGSGEAVLKLQRALRTSAALASEIEDVWIVSQKAEKKKDGIYYELHCVFKSE
jgi:Tfp pilus assembly protein PilN